MLKKIYFNKNSENSLKNNDPIIFYDNDYRKIKNSI